MLEREDSQDLPHQEDIPTVCTHSPDGYHEPQQRSTIPACQFCGKIL